jgi:hypothetical protein
MQMKQVVSKNMEKSKKLNISSNKQEKPEKGKENIWMEFSMRRSSISGANGQALCKESVYLLQGLDSSASLMKQSCPATLQILNDFMQVGSKFKKLEIFANGSTNEMGLIEQVELFNRGSKKLF